MRQLNFPDDKYEYTNDRFEYIKTDVSIVGKLEMLWTLIVMSKLESMTKKDHKINRRLKTKLREITQYQDKDHDARISIEGPQSLILEEDEYELLVRHYDRCVFNSMASEDADDLLEIIEQAKFQPTTQ